MRELIRAITSLLDAKAELIREEVKAYELGTYARGVEDGRRDVEEADYTFVYGEEDDDDR